jgi:hypothetical protein
MKAAIWALIVTSFALVFSVSSQKLVLDKLRCENVDSYGHEPSVYAKGDYVLKSEY